MKTLPETSPIPLTAELFDAMFDNDHFRARLSERWQEMEAEKAAQDKVAALESSRLHGTESILRAEFADKPGATEIEIEARRQGLYAEFDRRFRC